MPEIAHCSDCGRALPDYWPKALCPACALAALEELAVALDDSAAAEDGNAARAGDRVRSTPFGDYELLEEIDRGGMGVIYRARQVSLERIVALKMILAGQFASKEEVLRFRSEAAAAATMQHPNIVRIHETGERDGHHYFSMDYVPGRTLAALGRDGPMPAKRAARYAAIIADAMHYAHGQGVLHRDLKPSNVIVDANDQPWVTDFGLAKRVGGDFDVTVTGQVLGSPNYMPPEQTSAKSGPVGPASDVYGMGAVLYHLLTGRPPFHAGTIEELLLLLRDAEPVAPRLLNPSVPRDLETICLKCLEKEPGRRYPTAQALGEELNRFLRDEPIEARPLRSVSKLWRWCRRRPAIAGLSASVLLLLLVVAFGSTLAAWRVDRARRAEQVANRNLRQTVNLLELERAEDFFTTQDSAAGVAHLAAMLRRDPSNALVASRLVSALGQRNWSLPAAAPLRHSARVIKAVFSPDGRYVLSASWDKKAMLWDAVTSRAVATLPHDDRVIVVQYSRTGDQVLTASMDGSVRLWEAPSGRASGPPLRHQGKIRSAEMSEDGKWIVTTPADDGVHIWNAANGQLHQKLRGHTSQVVLARFTPDGRRVVTGGSHGSIRIWNTESGEMLFRVEDRGRILTSLGFSPDGNRLVSACEDGIVKLWDAATGAAAGEIKHGGVVWHAAFSPDSKWLLTTCEDGTARLWDVQKTRGQGEPMRHESGVIHGAFSPDGNSVVTTSSDNTARVWNRDTGRPLSQPLRHLERVLYAVFSPDGRRVVTASYDGIVQIWDLRKRFERVTEIRHDLNVAPLAFSPDGAFILTAARDKSVRMWNAITGRQVSEPLAHDSSPSSAAFAPDGRRVLVACSDGSARVWDFGTAPVTASSLLRPRVIAGPFRHRRWITAVEFNQDGTRMVTASVDGTAQVWEAASGRPVGDPLAHRGEVTSAHFSPDGRWVATASKDSTARVWDAATGQPVTGPLTHLDEVRSAEFSPDGERLLTASVDNSARIWSLPHGRLAISPLQHPRTVERAVFSPDGEVVATASLDRTARIWDARTGQALTPPLRHVYPPDRVYFTSDGKRLVTVTWKGVARYWDARTGRPLSEWLNAGGYWVTCFDRATDRIAVGTTQGLMSIWGVPRASTPVPDWFPAFAEAVAGLRLAESGSMELVPSHVLKDFSKNAAVQAADNNYAQMARWFLQPPRADPDGEP